MNYNIKDIIGKTFSELEDIILRNNYDRVFWKEHKNDPFLAQKAKLKKASISLFEIESDKHEFFGFRDIISHFNLIFREEKTIKLIEKLQNEYREDFQYFLTKGIPEVSWDLVNERESDQNEGFVQFKRESLEFKENIPFEICKIDDYEIIGARAESLNIFIHPTKAFINDGKKYYLAEIWQTG